MKIVLFALTGMGNEVLKSLLTLGPRSDILVFTRHETGSFPYYPCESLEHLCKVHDVACSFDCNFRSRNVHRLISDFNPGIGIASTFHKIVPESIRSIFTQGCFNIHSSLLPKFRGPTPTAWTILFDELSSGLTFHAMTDVVDEGDIYHQVAVAVDNMDDGELRAGLSRLAGLEVAHFLDILPAESPRIVKQSPNSGSAQPHILSSAGLQMVKDHSFKSSLIRRASTPYPGYEQFMARLAMEGENSG